MIYVSLFRLQVIYYLVTLDLVGAFFFTRLIKLAVIVLIPFFVDILLVLHIVVVIIFFVGRITLLCIVLLLFLLFLLFPVADRYGNRLLAT